MSQETHSPNFGSQETPRPDFMSSREKRVIEYVRKIFVTLGGNEMVYYKTTDEQLGNLERIMFRLMQHVEAIQYTHWKVGTRVTRPFDIHKMGSKLIHGVVVERYSQWSNSLWTNSLNFYPELYRVKWDHKNEVSTGYLRHGLSAEEHKPNNETPTKTRQVGPTKVVPSKVIPTTSEEKWNRFPDTYPDQEEDFGAFARSRQVMFCAQVNLSTKTYHFGYYKIYEDDVLENQWTVSGRDGYTVSNERVIGWKDIPECPL